MRDVVDLYQALVTEFATASATTQVVFGNREKYKQINQGTGTANRVVIEPTQGDAVGDFLPPRMPGANPIRVGQLRPTLTIYVWGYDSTAPNDASLQYRAARDLFRKVVSVLHSLGAGEVQVSRVMRVRPEQQISHGEEWKFLVTMIDDLEAITSDAAVTTTDAAVNLQFNLPVPEP